MHTLLLFVLLMVIASALAFKIKYEIAQTIPITCFLIILLLYISGFTGNLMYGMYAIYALCAGSLLYCCYFIYKNGKLELKRILNPALVVFFLFFTISWWANAGKLLTSWDEFSHWGTVVKNMNIFDAFGNDPRASIMFPGYPPAAALFEYFVIKIYGGIFLEGKVVQALNILCFSLFMPLFKQVRFKEITKTICYMTIMLVLPTIFYETYYGYLYVDALLGVLFAYSLLAYFTSEKLDYPLLINLALSLFTLTLVKASGFGLALIAGFIIIADILLNKRKTAFKKSFLIIFAASMVIIPILSNYTWAIQCNKVGTANAAERVSQIKFDMILEFIKLKGPLYRYQTLTGFGYAFFDTAITKKPVELTVFSWALIFAIFSLYFYRGIADTEKKSRLKAALTGIFLGLMLYIIALCMLYVFTYSPYEAVRLASYGRYMNTYLLGMTLFAVFIYMNSIRQEDAGTGKAGDHTIRRLVMLALCVCFFGQLSSLLEITAFAHLTIQGTQTSRAVSDTINRIKPLLNENDAIYFICPDTGEEILKAKFNMTPIDIRGPSSIGAPLYPEDIWTINISCEEWMNTLKRDCTYVYLYKISDKFIQEFGAAFENIDDIRDKALYRVVHNGNGVILRLVPI